MALPINGKKAQIKFADFLSDEMKQNYLDLISRRMAMLTYSIFTIPAN